MVFKLKLAPSVSRMKIASCSHKASSWLPGGTRSPFLGEEGGEPQVGQADAFTGLRPSGAPGLEGGRRDELAKEKLRFQTWKKQEGTFYVPGDPGRHQKNAKYNHKELRFYTTILGEKKQNKTLNVKIQRIGKNVSSEPLAGGNSDRALQVLIPLDLKSCFPAIPWRMSPAHMKPQLAP